MKRLIDSGLEQVSTMLIRMSELAQEAVSLSVISYIENSKNHIQVKDISANVSSMVDPIEDTIFEIIVRFQPVASDLRILKSYIKICYDLERFGRYAFDIVQIYEKLGGIKEPAFKNILEEMSENTIKMVKASIQALKCYDVEQARNLTGSEEKVDKLYSKYLDTLISSKITKLSTISSLLVVRYLERIADHASYIGESIIYLSTGERSKLR
jgi:phosphate transport system protein